EVMKRIPAKKGDMLVKKNQWTQGTELMVFKDRFMNKPALDMEALETAFFIFDTEEKLVDVRLEFERNRYNELKQHLQNKYTKISERELGSYGDLIKDDIAEFKSGPVAITIKSTDALTKSVIEYKHDEYAKAEIAGAEREEQEHWNADKSNL